jgi:hypothetical protein
MAKQRITWEDPDKWYYYLDISGPKFSPEVAERETGLVLFEKIERGQLLLRVSPRHPFFGKPVQQGSAILQPPKRIARYGQGKWVLKTLGRYGKMLRRLGAENVVFWQVKYFPEDSQENFELSIADIAILAMQKVPYCLSIYHLNPKELQKMPERLYSKRKRANQALVTTATTQTPSATATAPLSHL